MNLIWHTQNKYVASVKVFIGYLLFVCFLTTQPKVDEILLYICIWFRSPVFMQKSINVISKLSHFSQTPILFWDF